MIDRATVDRIYATANIVEVVGDFVALKKKGVNYSACCPFHNEKTPSFVVSPSKGVYKCFGCGKGGNAVTFVMEHEKMTYVEAMRFLAKKYGIPFEEKEETPEEKQRNDDRESMMVVNSWAADYFRDQMFSTDRGMSVAHAYFAQRGLSDGIIKRFGLGFCPDGGDQMTRAALTAGYKEQFLVDTGLTIKRETGGYYDRFCGRVMFPIYTISGRVTAFSGRALKSDTHAKYVNSPESTVYSKSNNVFGLYFAKSAITKENFCIVVEGNVDVVQMHQKGIENVVAPLGTALTVEQVRLIGRFTKNITLLFDGDKAGLHAAIKGVDLVLREGMNVRVVVLPDGEDPDSFARAHTAVEVRDYIATNEKDFISFKSGLYAAEAAKDPIRRAEVISDIVHSIAEVPDKIQRSVFTKDCARIMEIDEALLINEVARKRMSVEYDRPAQEFVRSQQSLRRREGVDVSPDEPPVYKFRPTGSSIVELEKELVGYLIKYGHKSFDYRDGSNTTSFNVADTILGDLEADGLQFSQPCYRTLIECYKAHRTDCDEEGKVPEHYFFELADPEACNAAVDILTLEENHRKSKMWAQHEIFIESEEDRLGKLIPRAIMLYKSKSIEMIIRGLEEQLADESLSDEEHERALVAIDMLNRERTKIARKIARNIL